MATALVVLVPEAEPVVGPWRARHDPVAAIGVPAHITLIHPFLDDPVGPRQLEDLREILSGQPRFSYRLGGGGRFDATLYLMPEPAEPFRLLVRTLVDRFGVKPYEGRHWPEIVPHLTVGDRMEPAALVRLEAEFSEVAAARLPLDCTASAVVLLAHRNGWWHRIASVALGSPA